MQNRASWHAFLAGLCVRVAVAPAGGPRGADYIAVPEC